MKIFHASDLHLGVRAFRRSTPEGRNVREQDVQEAFSLMVTMIGRRANPSKDLAVFAGDIYDTPKPSNRVISETREGFKKLGATVDTVILGGNHDRPNARPTDGNPVELLGDIAGVTVAIDPVVVEKAGVKVVCIPDHADERDQEGVQKLLREYAGEDAILLIHAAIADQHGKILYAKFGDKGIPIDSLAPHRWLYIAAGDYHDSHRLAPNAYYSGSFTHAATGEWESAGDERGFLVYDTEVGGPPKMVEVPGRTILDLPQIDGREMDGPELTRVLAEMAAKTPLKDAVVRQRVLVRAPGVLRTIDPTVVRDLKAQTVDFLLKPVIEEREEGPGEDGKVVELDSRPVEELVEEFAMGPNWTPDPGIEREAVLEIALASLVEEVPNED